MQTEERFAQNRAMQTAQDEAYTALCQHLEHAPDGQILSDYTAVLVYGTASDRREDALRLIRGQLYSRNSRDTGRVESWFADCCARIRADQDGFLQKAQDDYIREGLAEEERQLKAEKAAKKKRKFRIRPACEFAPEVAEYLVEPYLPRGMISILGGVSGAGKTSLALDICARLAREKTCTVIYLTAENDPNKVLWVPTCSGSTVRRAPATPWATRSFTTSAAPSGLTCWCSTPSRATSGRACR